MLTNGPSLSRRREDLAAALVREIQGPSASITALLDVLQRQALPSAAAACVQGLRLEADRLTKQVSAAAELLHGGAAATSGDVVLRRFLDELVDRDGVVAAFEGEADLAVHVDAARLGQTFIALLEHVAGPGDGRAELALSVLRRGGQAELTLRVRGPGRPDGESLALMLARRQIAEWQGGLVFSPTPGGGMSAELRLHLPLVTQTATVEADRPADAGPGLHVLIVDDNATNRLVAEAFCEMFGCTSECAEDGVEAVEAVRIRRFDLILMDIKMPRMDGVEATRAIRVLPGPERATPILALTANADPVDVRRYLAAGMADVIEKPIKADRLAQALSAVAEASEQRAVAA